MRSWIYPHESFQVIKMICVFNITPVFQEIKIVLCFGALNCTKILVGAALFILIPRSGLNVNRYAESHYLKLKH